MAEASCVILFRQRGGQEYDVKGQGKFWLQVATMSAFWASVVLGRAFELYSEPNTVPFSTAYDWASSNIDPLADYEPFIKGTAALPKTCIVVP